MTTYQRATPRAEELWPGLELAQLFARLGVTIAGALDRRWA